MSDDAEFVSRFYEVQREADYRQVLTPTQAVGDWEDLLEQVRAGYQCGLDEYRNDLYARNCLEKLLNDEQLSAMHQTGWVREAVEGIDAQFEELLQPEPLPHGPHDYWWEAHAPRYGGRELAQDYPDRHGIRIEVREDLGDNGSG